MASIIETWWWHSICCQRWATFLKTFQQDSAPADRVCETIELLSRKTPDFIRPEMWPPNSPDLIQWNIPSGLMEQRVYQERIQNTDELRQRILTVWNELEQQIIDNAVDQWRDCLAASVQEEGVHFEQTLWKQFTCTHSCHWQCGALKYTDGFKMCCFLCFKIFSGSVETQLW